MRIAAMYRPLHIDFEITLENEILTGPVWNGWLRTSAFAATL